MTSLASEPGQAPWCERCEWGLDRYEPAAGRRFLGRRIDMMGHRLAQRATMAQFGDLKGRTPERPGFSGAGALVLAVALILYGFEIALLVGGVWLVLYDFANVTLVLGIVALLLAVVLAPRLGRIRGDDERLRREDAPALFGLVDRVAAAAAVPPPHVILVDHRFNASSSGVGPRRRRVLCLGLMLFGALEPQQRVALLAHELGHFANGDIRRGLLTQPAVTTLARLSFVMRPSRGVRAPRVTERLINVVFRVLASGLLLAHFCVVAVALRAGQRAEYFADALAARVAGTRAATELLDSMDEIAAGMVATSARRGELEVGWRAALAGLRATRQGRVARLRQLSVRREVSLWASHPPTGLRARLLAEAPWAEPAVGVSETESAKIDAELAPYYQQFRRAIAATGF